jgi:PAS domain S-box-containing protein
MGAPLPQLLDDIVRFIEAQSADMLCSIVLLDTEHGCIRSGAAPNLPPEYSRALDGAAVGPHAGSCGAAAFSGERIVVDDIATHPNWKDYRHLALPHGLRACWSNPIFAQDRKEVLGTFAMYYHEARGPAAQEIEWVEVASHLASIAILRARAEQALRHSELRAQQLARLYAVSNGINEAIVRMREPQALYDFACRIAVEQGLARLAWVGLCASTEGRILPVARFGNADAYVDSIQLSLADDRMNDGPVGRAIKSGAPAVSNDIANDEEFYWKDAALSRGLRSCAAFPLKVGGRSIGAFALYAEQTQYFAAEEIGVLSTLAADISFALESAANERERRHMEEAMRASETLRATIYSNVEDAIFYLAVEGPKRFRFVSVNPAFLQATGLRESQVIGQQVSDVIPEPSLTLVLEKYAQAIAQRAKVSWEEVTPYPKGLRYGEVSISPIFDANGQCIHIVGTVHDMTARKLAEEERLNLEAQLHQSQRMQSLGTLVGGIAHDFNNILAAISCNIDLALLEPTAQEPVRQHLVDIQKASGRAIELVRQILTFSRREQPKREVLHLREIVEEALKLLQATLPKNITLMVRCDADVPKVSADPTQIHQIIMNLGVNAVHAMRANGGTLEVNLSRCTFAAGAKEMPAELAEGNYVRLRVTDTGSGMDAGTLKRAFDPFFTTKPIGEGTGLGLSVVHGIVKSHQGGLDVQSELGRGTTFSLYFPALAIEESEPAVAVPATGQGERVMYVDDEEALTFLVTRALSRMGYRVTGHSNSMAALQDFRSRPTEFDIVVTDISMPDLSGPELARELRLVRPDVPIVMTSGYIRPEDIEAAAQLRINQLVYKPSTVTELGQILSQQIGALHS